MKWLKTIFQREQPKNKIKFFQLSDLVPWLDERCNGVEFEKSLEDINTRIKEVAESFSRDLNALKMAVPDEATPARLLKVGLAARAEVIKQLESLEKNLVSPKDMDIDTISSYHWTLVKGLERTVTKYNKAHMYMAALFPQEAETLNSDLNRLSHQLVRMEDEIRKKRKEMEEIWYSKELIAEIRIELSGIGDLERRIKKNEERLSELHNFKDRLEFELRDFESSEAGTRAGQLKNILDVKREELKRLDDELENLVFPLTKALTRIVKQGSSERLTLQHRDILELLSKSPSQALDDDTNDAIRELRSNLATLGLKDKKKEKIIAHIDFLIENKPLESLKSRRNKLQNDIQDLEEKFSRSCHEINLFRKDLNKTRKDIKDIETELDQNRKDLISLEEKASSNSAELRERIAKIAGEPVEIELVLGD
ncbi:MAG: hypothetical protein MUO26_12620 [Methanotrichaceae archaeon]|nr:hypothetical protein [Methanotrichaceae archaeon]